MNLFSIVLSEKGIFVELPSEILFETITKRLKRFITNKKNLFCSHDDAIRRSIPFFLLLEIKELLPKRNIIHKWLIKLNHIFIFFFFKIFKKFNFSKEERKRVDERERKEREKREQTFMHQSHFYRNTQNWLCIFDTHQK